VEEAVFGPRSVNRAKGGSFHGLVAGRRGDRQSRDGREAECAMRGGSGVDSRIGKIIRQMRDGRIVEREKVANLDVWKAI